MSEDGSGGVLTLGIGLQVCDRKEIIMKRYGLPRKFEKEVKDLKTMLRQSALLYGDCPAVETVNGDEAKKVTYKQLYSDSISIGTALMNRYKPNFKIGIIGDNCYEWIMTYLSSVNGTAQF